MGLVQHNLEVISGREFLHALLIKEIHWVTKITCRETARISNLYGQMLGKRQV